MSDLQTQLVKYLTDAHALEQNSLQGLRSAATHTSDAAFKQRLERHIAETERHKELLEQRLEALGESPSKVKDAAQGMAGAAKQAVDAARPDSSGKVARDAYVAESLEIVSYELLKRVATTAGDQASAAVAEQILREERAMRDDIEASLDRLAAISLEEEKALTTS